MLTIVDAFTRECLAIDVARKLTSQDVLVRLSDLFVRRGVPDHIGSDNGSEFTAKRVREWLERVGMKTLYIEPGLPWENGYVESFKGNLLTSCWAAKSLTPSWRRRCSSVVAARRTTPSARTARWGAAPRPRSRAAPVRLVRLRLTKRTGAIP